MTKPQDIDWTARAATLRCDGRWLLDGQRRTAEAHFDKHSPVDGRLLGAVARGAAAEVQAAVLSGRAAFDDGRWAQQPPGQRKRVLLRWAELLLAAREELALLECLDMGKPVRNAWQVDVPGAVRCLQWTAEAIDKVYGELAPTGPGALALVQREPMGVVGAIVPWNYPLLMAMWKLAPALACGNSVVLKPSEKSPFSALRLADLAHEAGLPPGVLNVVPGYGSRGRRGAGPAPRRGRHRLHRLHRHRASHAAVRRAEQPQARLQRAGRQVGLHRVRRLRRSGACRQGLRRRDVLQQRPELQRALAPAGAAGPARRLLRGLAGVRAPLPPGRPAALGHRDGSAGRRRPAAARDALHRVGSQRGRPPADRRAAAAAARSRPRCSTPCSPA
jgi:delta 1-pyrroline-5-carboxylate dehydrogenase